MGRVCATLANIHRTADSQRVFEPGDFIPVLRDEGDAEDQEPETIDVAAASKAIEQMLGRKD